MSSPQSIAELMALLGGRDPGAALEVARAAIPGQVRDIDQVRAFVWATVDLERTSDTAAIPLVPGERDRILGASVGSVHIAGLELLVEEPSTEGRLAANLARFGEGIAAVYVEARTVGDMERPRQTPLGRQGSLRPHEHPWGPFVIALQPDEL
jgi:hypothetical protein